MQIAYLSDTGTKKSDNQDFVGIFNNAADIKLAVVADGVTSLKGGDVASEMVVHNFGHAWAKTKIDSIDEAKNWLNKVADEENQRILDAGAKYDDLSSMATTFVSAIIIGKQLLIANLGDSRAYLFEPKLKNLQQLSTDHSLGNELLANGVITKEEVATIPKSQAITRYFGTRGEVVLDFTVSDIDNLDIVMLATDGLNKEVDDQLILSVLNQENISLGEMSAKLINIANQESGFDNVTVLLMSQLMEED